MCYVPTLCLKKSTGLNIIKLPPPPSSFRRVIGGGNRRKHFLACTLAGSTDDAVLYVSKRGFDAGHRDSWFMRDMDRDGRDDYCRSEYVILSSQPG